MLPPETEALLRLQPETITARSPRENRTASPGEPRRAVWQSRPIRCPGLGDRDFLQGNRCSAKYVHRECAHGRGEKLIDAPGCFEHCHRHGCRGEWDISCRLALTAVRPACSNNSTGPDNSPGNGGPDWSITIYFSGNRVDAAKVWLAQGPLRRPKRCGAMMPPQDGLRMW